MTKNKLEKVIDVLIKSIESKELPSHNRIKKKELIANKQKFIKLKNVIIEQLRVYHIAQKKKYRINEIKEKIGYKSNITRIRNTIKY